MNVIRDLMPMIRRARRCMSVRLKQLECRCMLRQATRHLRHQDLSWLARSLLTNI